MTNTELTDKALSDGFLTTENKVLFLLLFFGLLIRFLTMLMVETGGDAVGVWFFSKKILFDIQYQEWNHHSARFGMILPVLFFQKIFGTHPVVYFIPPLVFYLIQIIFLFKIGLRLGGLSTAVLSSLLLILFPQMVQHGIQIKPGTFSAAYILISIYFFLRYSSTDYKKSELVISAFFMFLAYLSKITSLFLLPGFFVAIYLVKKSYKDAFIFGIVLFILFLLETLVYYIHAGFPMGRLSIIFGSHLKSQNLQPLISFWTLFDRYIKLKIYWKLLFFLFMISGILIIFFRKYFNNLYNKNIRYLAYMGLSFFVCVTFTLKSINPIVTAVTFKDRHLIPATPLMILVISYTIILIYRYFMYGKGDSTGMMKKSIWKKEEYFYLILIISLSVFSIAASKIAFSYFPKYSHGRFFKKHPLKLICSYYDTLNSAFEKGVPIVQKKVEPKRFKNKVIAVESLVSKGLSQEEACRKLGIAESDYLYSLQRVIIGDYKAFKVVTHLFLDYSSKIDKNFKLPNYEKFMIGNKSIGYLIKKRYKRERELKYKNKIQPEEQVVAVYVYPFRVETMKFGDFLNK